MNLNDMIYCRKSVRSYTGAPVDMATMRKIESFILGIKPLCPEIRVRSEIVDRGQIKCMLPWVTPQLVAIYTEDREGALENVGFMFQQLDLYIQSLGMGACWLGMGRMNKRTMPETAADDGLKFAMLIAFGYPKEEARRSGTSEFKRKALGEISDREDARLEPARLAPSSVNSQPWYFAHDGETIHAHCIRRGVFGAKALGDMNRIDMGIALAHMYVSNPETFRFFHAEDAQSVKGYGYIGSFVI